MSTATAPRNAAGVRRLDRRNLILAGLAVVQAGALAFVLLTVAAPPKTQVGPLLGSSFAADKVTAITITDSDGKTVQLAHDSGSWTLPVAGGYPADDAKVSNLLDTLAGLQANGLVATSESSYKRLKVGPDDYQAKIDLKVSGGGTTTLLVGSSPSYGSTHLRVDGDKGVYLSHTLKASDARTDPSTWIDPQVLSLDPANVTKLEVNDAQGDFVFRKDASGWSMAGLGAGDTFDPSTVATAVSRIATLRVHAPLGKDAKPAYGFDAPTAVLTLTTTAPAAGDGANGAKPKGAAGNAAGAADNGGGAAGAGADTATAPGAGATAPGTAASATAPGTAASSAAASPNPPNTNAPGAAGTNGTGASAAGANSTSTNANNTNANNTSPNSTSPNSTNANSTNGNAAATGSPATAAQATTTTTTITVGAKQDDGNYAVRLSSSPYVFAVSDFALGELPSKAKADFLKKPDAKGAGTGGAGTGGAGAAGAGATGPSSTGPSSTGPSSTGPGATGPGSARPGAGAAGPGTGTAGPGAGN